MGSVKRKPPIPQATRVRDQIVPYHRYTHTNDRVDRDDYLDPELIRARLASYRRTDDSLVWAFGCWQKDGDA